MDTFWTAQFVVFLILEVVKGSEAGGVVGEDAYLNWTISSLARDTTRYIRNPANNASLVIFFRDDLTPSFTDSRIRFTGDLLQGIVSLTLFNVKLSDAGKYTFVKEAGGQNMFLGGQVLIVAESPSLSRIAALLPTAVAGQDFQLNCSAFSRSVPSDHNMPMLSEWKRNGTSITLGLKYSVSGTILTIINLSRADNGDSFICRAFEDQRRKSIESHDFTLNIIYGPDNMQIIPVGDLTIDEGRSVNITCSAECSPPCDSYQWQNGSDYTSLGSSQSLVILKVKREHAGVYLCTVTNMAISKRATTKINVTVNYGPDTPLLLIPNNTSYRVVETSTIPNISCTSPCFPSCDFQWTGPVMFPSGVISLGTVTRSESGNYTCMGQNLRTHNQVNSDVVTLIVIYGPDTPVIVPSTTMYLLNEGNVLPNIQCLAECFPSCKSYWYKSETAVPGSPADILSMGNVYRNETGIYTCRSENTESKARGENSLQLVVHYPPTITIDSRNGSHSETGHMINCSAHGLPEQYTYILTHSSLFSGIEIRQLSYKTISTGVIVHQFNNLSYMDTGIYKCTVNNGIPDYKDGSLDQSVSSTVWIKGAPYLTSSDSIFQAEKGESAKLLVEFYNSLMDAQVTWYRLKNGALEPLQNTDKYNISLFDTMVIVSFYSVHIQQPGLMTTLEIRNTTEEDFTSYEVHAQNYAGEMSSWILQLTPRDSRQQTVSDNEADSVIVGSVLGTCIPIAFLAVIMGVLLYQRRKLCNAEMSSDQMNTNRSTTAEGTSLECRDVLNTVAAGREYECLQKDKDANIYLDLQDATGEIKDNVNTRSAVAETYDVLKHANNPDHAYDSLNKNLGHTGEKYVYENTKIPKFS